MMEKDRLIAFSDGVIAIIITIMVLEDLSQKLNISRERVRQIEVRAFEKLQQNMKIAAEREGLLTAP